MINEDILGYAQRALLGYVTPNLRAVNVFEDNNSVMTLLFIYDDPPTEDEEELASLADTEFIADVSSPNCKTNYLIEVLEYPKPLPQKGVCIYLRYEPSITP